MLKTLLSDEHNRFQVVEEPEQISEIVKDRKRQLWIDVERPTKEELALIQDEFGLHPLAMDDAVRQHQRPKVDQYEDTYFVVFYAISITERSASESTGARTGLRGSRFHQTPDDVSANGKLPNGRDDDKGDDRSDSKDRGVHRVDGAVAVPMAGPDGHEQILLREIAMFLGRNYLITVHNQPAPEFDEVAKRWYRNVQDIKASANTHRRIEGARPLTDQEASVLKPTSSKDGRPNGPTTLPGGSHAELTDVITEPPIKGGDFIVPAQPDQVEETEEKQPQHASDIGILLYSLLDTMVDSYFPVIDNIVDRVEDLEEQIFERFNERALELVFSLKKDLLALRKVLAPERDVLNVLTRRDLPIFEEHTIVYFQDVYDHVVRITDSIDTYRDLLSSALDSFLSMQSNRLNVTVQTLTSFSIILMSIATFTGWYGMNFENMPELHSAYGYPVLALVILTIVGIEVAYFKRRGWL